MTRGQEDKRDEESIGAYGNSRSGDPAADRLIQGREKHSAQFFLLFGPRRERKVNRLRAPAQMEFLQSCRCEVSDARAQMSLCVTASAQTT